MAVESKPSILIVGEAMSSGIPCVVTDVGDSARIVGQTGIVVPPRDSQSLANALEKFFSLSSQERKKLGVEARHRIEENYTIEGMVKTYQNLYEEIYRVERGHE